MPDLKNLLIKDVPAELHKEFKMLCLVKNQSMKDRMIYLMSRDVMESKRKQIEEVGK